MKKEKVLLYGLGRRFVENKEFIEKKYDIEAIIDCDYQKHGKYELYNVISPSKICEYSFEKIIITPKDFQSVLAVLQAKEIPNEKIELLVCENDYGHIWKNVSMMPFYDFFGG